MRDQRLTRRRNTIAVSGYDATNLPKEADEFDVAIASFIRHCKIRTLSGQTITNYQDVFKFLEKLLRRRI